MHNQLKTLTPQKKKVTMRVKKFLASSATLPLILMDFRTPLRSLQQMSLTEMVQLKW
jgi:hypothetical protein